MGFTSTLQFQAIIIWSAGDEIESPDGAAAD
jgi:hypothetical protein